MDIYPKPTTFCSFKAISYFVITSYSSHSLSSKLLIDHNNRHNNTALKESKRQIYLYKQNKIKYKTVVYQLSLFME